MHNFSDHYIKSYFKLRYHRVLQATFHSFSKLYVKPEATMVSNKKD
jgi:hypothetical protein